MPTGVYIRIKPAWNKDKKGLCLNTGKTHFKKGFTPWNKDKHSGNYGNGFKKGQPSVFKGKKRENIRGKNHWNWKGGITPENIKIKNSIEFRLWRESVFARDNWTCQKCGIRNGEGKAIYLIPHHIQNFAQYPELRFAIDNGITFCRECHNLFHKIYSRKNNTKEQIEQFIQRSAE